MSIIALVSLAISMIYFFWRGQWSIFTPIFEKLFAFLFSPSFFEVLFPTHFNFLSRISRMPTCAFAIITRVFFVLFISILFVLKVSLFTAYTSITRMTQFTWIIIMRGFYLIKSILVPIIVIIITTLMLLFVMFMTFPWLFGFFVLLSSFFRILFLSVRVFIL